MSKMEQYNILIVDEDEATRCTLADLLRGRDEYRVLVAGEGREAVRMFVEEARIDIVLTDIHMPGFNCLELMSDMQRLRHRPEILVMTSNGSSEVIEKARQIGARSVILKPFEHLDLIEAEVEKAVQALFETRATSSCKMMVPPAAKRNTAAPTATASTSTPPPPAAAKSEAATPAPATAGATGSTPPIGTHAAPAGPPPAARPAPPEMIADEEIIVVEDETPVAGQSAPDSTSAAAPAKPIEVAGTPPIPADPAAPPDAGLTMRIDRPDFAVAPSPPAAQPAPKQSRPDMPAAAGGDAKPASAASPASSGDPGGHDPRRSPAADRMRGRVGLPNLGALKTKLFGKGTDLSGGHLARGGFSDLVPTGASPASPPATPAASTETSHPVSGDRPASDRPDGPSMTGARPSRQPVPRAESAAPGPPSPATVEPTVPPLESAHGSELIAPPMQSAEVAAPVITPVEMTQEAEPNVPPLEIAEADAPVNTPVEMTQEVEPNVPPLEIAEAEITQGTRPIVPPVESEEAAAPAGTPVEITEEAGPTVPPVEMAAEPEPGVSPMESMTADGAGDPESASGKVGSGEPIAETGGEADGKGALTVPAELETILAAGADVDIDKMALQIPIICLQTWEEQAALDLLGPLAGTMKRAFHTWSATRGIVKEDGTVMGEMYCEPMQALEFIRRQRANGLYVLVDFRNCLDDRKVVRMLREMFEAGETSRGMLVLTAPVIPVPPELQPACQVFDWPPGGAVNFDQVLEEVRTELSTDGDDAIDLDPEARRLLIERVQGMPAGRARFEFLCALRGREQPGG